MTSFLGRYEYQLDEKGRVSLPSAFRREAEDDRFVLLQWKAPALTLFPRAVWSATQERLLTFRRNEPEAWREVLAITASAVEVHPDKQGRILIPSWLQEAGGLDGSVLLIGNIDRIELWDPTAFETALEGRTGAFDGFASQIFG
ncbi:MAG: division/cell wall cluster transcriptional repressor MraZ [Gemmatimonadota bacterium]|nr:MAG: division/cell wall cluster transcriptional repressor MraZ [Gemmatimonadota bacterium]